MGKRGEGWMRWGKEQEKEEGNDKRGRKRRKRRRIKHLKKIRHESKESHRIHLSPPQSLPSSPLLHHPPTAAIDIELQFLSVESQSVRRHVETTVRVYYCVCVCVSERERDFCPLGAGSSQ